ncbi:MAG TPA: protein-glutamate O-methyltransferase CheR [Isosphaeraceae bacterium]|nr:protein-glutamate O-methyltransferase CheR [Isosphaeraceae bacterium]
MTPAKPLAELTDDEFGRFRALIYRVAGIRIPPTKRVMVSNRIRRRLRATGIGGFSAYYAHLTSAAGGGEMPRFLDEITTNETYFYRDPHHYQWLADSFLPEVARQARLRRHPRRLRFWSAACSTGEEPYSIALKLLAYRPQLPGWSLTVLGTDLSTAALDAARAACYDEKAVRLVPPDERRTRFDHDPVAGRWTLKPEARALVSWKAHNLITPLREEEFDCIFIKNILIYFDEDSKRVVVGRLIDLLAEGGFLVVGPTEGIHKMLDGLVRHRPWLYQKPGRHAAEPSGRVGPEHRRAADGA